MFGGRYVNKVYFKEIIRHKVEIVFKLRNYFYRNIFASCGHQTVFLGKVYFYNPHFIPYREEFFN